MCNVPLIRFALHMVLIVGFLLGTVSIVLRRQKVLGGVAQAEDGAQPDDRQEQGDGSADPAAAERAMLRRRFEFLT